MAPKGKQETSKKAENKAKAKIIEDKTFGLKNKNKSAKVGKYVASIEAQVKSSGDRKAAKLEEAKAALRKKMKEEEEAKKAELALIAKPVVSVQKVAFGTDPKSVICQYFKVGQCLKGDKCKFSHDMNVERKSAKIDMYSDARDREEKEQDTMDTWDQDKLETVVQKKHGQGIRTTTDIVCRYFIEAIENRKYGWFWECPNGGSACKYRHALPPGFVLKPKASNANSFGEDEEESISLEEFLETERHKLEGVLTPITEETFLKWKADRIERQAEEASAQAKKRELEIKAGRIAASGRDLFVANPELFQLDDEEAMDSEYLQMRDSDNEIHWKDENLFLEEDLEALNIKESESQGSGGSESDTEPIDESEEEEEGED